MRLNQFIGISVLTCMVLPMQESVHFERKWVANENQSYSVTLTLNSNVGDVIIEFELISTTKRIFEDGSSQLDFKIQNSTAKTNDMNVPLKPSRDSFSASFDKYAVPISKEHEDLGVLFQLVKYVGILPNQPMKVGDTLSLNFDKKQTANIEIKGNLQLIENKEHLSKISGNIEIHKPNNRTPMKLSLTYWVDQKNGVLIEAEGTATNLPSRNNSNMPSSTLHFVFIKKAH